MDLNEFNETIMFPEIMKDKFDSSFKDGTEYIARLSDKENKNTIVYLDSKENITEYMFSEAVKYIDAKGIVRDKTTKLISTEMGYTNIDNDVKLMFSSDINQGILLEYNDIKVKSVPETEEINIKKAELTETTVFSNPHNSNHVVYENTFGIGTRIIYTPAFSGYKEDIIVDKYNGRTDYSFILYTNGMILKDQYLYDKAGEEAGCFSEIIVFDAEGKTFSGKIKTETLEEGEKYRVTYILSEQELKNAVYPVDIDPSFTVNTSGSGSGKTIQDANLYTITGSFYGSATSTIVSVGGIHPLYAPGVYARSVFKFPGLYNDIRYNMLNNTCITSVKLYLYLQSKETSSATVKAYPSTTSWTESDESVRTLYPAYSTSTSNTTTVGNVNEYTEINFTNVVKGWKNENYDQNKGVMLVCDNEASVLNIHFRSTENSLNKPYVTMTYNVTNTFYINSKYSNRFKNAYGTTASNSMISNAHAFTNIVLGTFGKTLVSQCVTNATLIPDSCTGGYNDSCVDAGCGDDCYASHHRNILRLFDNVYDSSRSINTIYVEWYNVSRTKMCESRESTHVVKSIMAGAGWAPDHANGVSNGGISEYIHSMPVIGIYTLSTVADQAISAKILLAHEMMHVMGIYDTYDTQPNHQWNGLLEDDSNDQICIMGNFSSYYKNYDVYYEQIEQGIISPFCSYCENLIASVIDTRYFPAN